jgi:hypothetical protein
LIGLDSNGAFYFHNDHAQNNIIDNIIYSMSSDDVFDRVIIYFYQNLFSAQNIFNNTIYSAINAGDGSYLGLGAQDGKTFDDSDLKMNNNIVLNMD